MINKSSVSRQNMEIDPAAQSAENDVHLKTKIDAGIVSLLNVYHRVLGRIAEFDQSDAEGARVRSRIQCAE